MKPLAETKRNFQQFGLSWVLLALLLLGIFLVVININKRQIFGPNAGAPGVFDANMTLSTNRSVNNLNVGDTFTVEVRVNSQVHDIYGADLVLDYNKDVLEVVANGIQLGGSVRNGCVTGNGNPAAVLAPITSETNCTFNAASVINSANTTGTLKVGVVAFDWSMPGGAAYTPNGFPLGATHHIASIQMRAKAAGNSPFTVKKIAQGNTTDTNIGTIFTNNTVGDVLNTISGNFTAQVGTGTAVCPRHPEGNVVCPDENNDGQPDSTIDISDFNAWLNKSKCVNDTAFYTANRALCDGITYNADVTGEGLVDISDFNVIRSHF